MPAPKSVYFGLALSFCTLGITIAGLASVQNACEDTADGSAYVSGVSSFSSPMLRCSKIYRYWWFVIGFEIFLFAGLLLTALLNGLKYTHASWMGMYAVGALLWISMTEAFLTAQDVAWYNTKATMAPKARVVCAGSLMTALLNTFLTIILGINEGIEAGNRTDAEEKAATI